MLRVWCLVAVLLMFAMPAKAGTTVFGSAVYNQSGAVTNAADALGPVDGLSAVIGRNASLTLLFPFEINGSNVTITGVKAGASTNVQIYLGAIVGGVPTWTAGLAFPILSGTASLDFNSACMTISAAAGCTLLRFEVGGGPTASFSLNGISGVTPEPGTWALMILSFVGAGWRLKSLRRNSPQFATIA